MNRWVPLAALALALVACDDDEELPENPPYAVPGHQVVQPPPGQPPAPAMPVAAPATFDPPLAVPGQPSPLPLAQPQVPPGLPPGPMPPGMPPGPIPPGPMPPGVPPGQMPPGTDPGQMPPGQMPPGQVALQPGQAPAPITLQAGFVPDPHVARGIAAGQVPASSLSPDPSCAGFVPAQPSHVLTLTTPFSNLRVLVSSSVDTVLVVRQPDGSFRCNDDAAPGQTLNPAIEGPFAPGAYTIWVGTYAQGTTGNYVIGFTELSHVTHATLGT